VTGRSTIRALLSLGLLAGCAHLQEERHEQEMREVRVAAYTGLLRGMEMPSTGTPPVYCLAYVHILGDDPPTWEVVDEDPEGLAALAPLHLPVAPASACDGQRGLGAEEGDRTVRVTIELIERPEPSVAVVRFGVWTRPGTGPSGSPRGKGWAVRLARVEGTWQTRGRERTWSRPLSSE